MLQENWVASPQQVLASGWHPSLHVPQQLLEIRGAHRQALPQLRGHAGSQERKPGMKRGESSALDELVGWAA